MIKEKSMLPKIKELLSRKNYTSQTVRRKVLSRRSSDLDNRKRREHENSSALPLQLYLWLSGNTAMETLLLASLPACPKALQLLGN